MVVEYESNAVVLVTQLMVGCHACGHEACIDPTDIETYFGGHYMPEVTHARVNMPDGEQHWLPIEMMH